MLYRLIVGLALGYVATEGFVHHPTAVLSATHRAASSSSGGSEDWGRLEGPGSPSITTFELQEQNID